MIVEVKKVVLETPAVTRQLANSLLPQYAILAMKDAARLNVNSPLQAPFVVPQLVNVIQLKSVLEQVVPVRAIKRHQMEQTVERQVQDCNASLVNVQVETSSAKH